MTISYNWLNDYLPVLDEGKKIDPEQLATILTSIGLEVEKINTIEEVKGGLRGLVIGEVMHVSQHPNADKLKLTKVNVGAGNLVQIVCGAPNVAEGQKVVVATVDTTIYPVNKEPLTMKAIKIRGEESFGMICAEDEIGLGDSHEGILVLPANAMAGTTAEDFFKPFSDIVYEIGLTPNRADAMSHWGVARDVCAYLSHHFKKEFKSVLPEVKFEVDNTDLPIEVTVESSNSCPRYAGVCISGIEVKESPKWLQQKLKSIGLKPINNIVDLTNFIQHETGQPLHAFDYDAITGQKVVVKNLPAGTTFITLDEKSRHLHNEDLMICNEAEGMCIAGVFGGLKSGVTTGTKNIFLESAFFNPVSIRKTSFRHNLRTDAATRFEKGIDISKTVEILKRAAMLIKEVAGGSIASEIVDIYPEQEAKKQINLTFQYLKKLSGKSYNAEAVESILKNLGFAIKNKESDKLLIEVPHHKRDISLPADIVEEILRIDGLDNIDIPTTISISPSVDENFLQEALKEKISSVLTGMGFTEILTNSITNSNYFTEEQLHRSVKLLNNLSSELNILRPFMLPTALEVVAFNQNRKNQDLKMFEFGKTYIKQEETSFSEENHLCFYISGSKHDQHWKQKAGAIDLYYIKGVVEALLDNLQVNASSAEGEFDMLDQVVEWKLRNKTIAVAGVVSNALAAKFDVKQTVYFADLKWDLIIQSVNTGIKYKEVPRFPAVERDLAMVVNMNMKYDQIKTRITDLKLKQLKNMRLFDVFQNEKIGAAKKSVAINFTFLDEEKTLTDKEIDTLMNKIMTSLEKDLGAEIRKQ
jgi:phenylalanyl-tRNA synthetase beta chain